jgi:hypothetical protein
MEIECQFLRTLIMHRPIQSLSINQVYDTSQHMNSEDGQGELEDTPMDIEEDSSQLLLFLNLMSLIFSFSMFFKFKFNKNIDK